MPGGCLLLYSRGDLVPRESWDSTTEVSGEPGAATPLHHRSETSKLASLPGKEFGCVAGCLREHGFAPPPDLAPEVALGQQLGGQERIGSEERFPSGAFLRGPLVEIVRVSAARDFRKSVQDSEAIAGPALDHREVPGAIEVTN